MRIGQLVVMPRPAARDLGGRDALARLRGGHQLPCAHCARRR